MTDEIQAEIEQNEMLKDNAINLCQKILVRQYALHRGFEDTTSSSEKFSQVPGKFLQIVHVPENHWILIGKGKFQEIKVYDSLKSAASHPKSVVKSIARIACC